MLSKRPAPSDSKGVLREYASMSTFQPFALRGAPADSAVRYVQSMESQQTRLIEALQKVHRDVQQSIKEEDMNEIVRIVRACGFDFEGVPQGPASDIENGSPESKHEPVRNESNVPSTNFERGTGKKSTDDKHQPPNIIHQGDGCAKKRKRGQPNDQIDSTTAKSSELCGEDATEDITNIRNGYSDDRIEPQASPLKRRKSATSAGLTEDYPNAGNYWDQVAGVISPSDPETLFAAQFPGQSTEASPQHTSYSIPQWPSMVPTHGLDDSSQPPICNDGDHHDVVNGPRETDLTVDAIDALSSAFSAGHDLESTLWWDPSLVFDMETGKLGLGVDDLGSLAFDLPGDFTNPAS